MKKCAEAKGGVANRADALPDFIEPCRARSVKVPPSGERWGHEIKMDGYRLQARIENGAVRLSTRTGLDWTARFRGLTPAFAGLPVTSAIIDGEIIVEDARGVSDFALLVAALKSSRSRQLVYVAFDLLHLDGASLLAQPFSERKRQLEGVLSEATGGPLRFCQHLEGDGPTILAAAAKLGVEGIVSKRLDGPYRPGREDWCKSKITLTDEFVVCGYTDATAPKESIGALALGFYDNGGLVYAGRVGTGFTREQASELWHDLKECRTTIPPVDVRDHEVRWVAPTLVAQVQYAGWTGDGILRHARLKGLREDKPASAVGRPR